jgi:putative transposase
MLTADELTALCQRLALSEQAQKTLALIRSPRPARRVGSGGKNVPVRYPSRKMGVIIQAESRTVELAGVYLMEHDATILEFWDQPNPPITLHYPVKLKNGRMRNTGVLHTPDFFVIREKTLEQGERTVELGWEEWKTEAALLEFEHAESNRYMRDEHGKWRCPPGEAVAAPLGFYYRVRSSAEIHEVFQRNLRFLSYYLREESLSVSDPAQEEVLTLVRQEPGISLSLLLEQIRVATSDDIYTLLVQDVLYTDLYAVPLAEPEQVHLFTDEETASIWSIVLEQQANPGWSRPHTILVEPGAPVVWDGRRCTILFEGQTTITLLTEDQQPVELSHAHFQALITTGKLTGQSASSIQGSPSQRIRERILHAKKAALLEAKRRYAVISPVLHGEQLVACTTPARTVRHWVASYREAAETLGCGYVGLLPKTQERGNRKPHLSAQALEYLTLFIDTEYENHKQKNKREVYGEFENYCKKQGLLSVPSYKTFVETCNRRPRYEQVKKRQGARAAYPREPMYWELPYHLPRHGDRPFEVVHIDHTLLDVELVDSQTRHHFGRPWATFLTDAFSRRLLAVYLTFDEPSYRSCMMVLRECVHRYHRFPELVVVDWGPEFESIYFETLLARYECSKASRPKAKPRFGAVIERLFNTANTTLIHHLAGNTQIMKHVRQVTKSVNPREHAVWTLGTLYAALRCWAYGVYDTIEHGTLKQTPKEVFETGLLRSGARPKQWIEYDDNFLQLTLPSTRTGTAKLVPGKGVKVNNIFYWARGDVFLDHPELEKKQLPVRYDPYDVGHIFVSIPEHRQPVECISEHYAQLKGHSERELHIAAEELRARHRHHSRQFSVTAAKLASFITSIEAQEALLAQCKRDSEARAVFALMEGRQVLAEAISAPQSVIHEETRAESASATPPLTLAGSAPDSRADDDIYEDF